jgi:hypothetical protein
MNYKEGSAVFIFLVEVIQFKTDIFLTLKASIPLLNVSLLGADTDTLFLFLFADVSAGIMCRNKRFSES